MNLLTKKEIEKQLDYCIEQIDKGITRYRYGYFPHTGKYSVYTTLPNAGWTSGFWTAMVLMAYEITHEEKYKEVVENHVNSFHERIINNYSTDHHDLGFEYTLSCVSAYKVLGSELAKRAALLAADKLCERYVASGRYIKPWSTMDDPIENRIIVDTYLNLPLLFWASEISENPKYKEIAKNHLDSTVDILVREDGRAYHTYRMDLKYGNPIMPVVDQGYADDSVWSRGQAWVVYGLALAYDYTKDEKLYQIQKKATNKFIELLPADNVPAWDMVFRDTRTLKDTSAGVIATCGMLEMNKLLPGHSDAERWNEKVHEMVRALIDNHLTNDENNGSSSILMHGTSSVRHNSGINESLIYGDYYYMETLMRMSNPNWKRYW